MTMQDCLNPTSDASRRIPWNKGKLIGAKPPLRPKHVWSIRTKLQMADRCLRGTSKPAESFAKSLFANQNRNDKAVLAANIRSHIGNIRSLSPGSQES
jgi:hypothetical protein